MSPPTIKAGKDEGGEFSPLDASVGEAGKPPFLLLLDSHLWGGAESYLWRMCREWLKLGVSIVVVCPKDGPVYGRFCELPLTACYQESLGVPTGRVRGLGSLALRLPGGSSRIRRILLRMRERHGCGVLICQDPREQVLAGELARSMGYFSIWIFHSYLNYWIQRALLLPELRRCARQVDRIFVISEATTRRFVQGGFPSAPLTSARVGIDIPTHRSCGPLSTFSVGVVSRLVEQKGIQDALQAFGRLLSKFPDLELLIAGDGHYRPKLEKLAKNLRIERAVTFLGFVPDPWTVFGRLSLLVHPTFDPGDSMPTNILEAAAMGVPAIATRWSGIPEIVRDGETGLLIPPRDVDALTTAMDRLLSDPQLRSRLGQAARERVVPRYGISTVAREFLEGLPVQTQAAPGV